MTQIKYLYCYVQYYKNNPSKNKYNVNAETSKQTKQNGNKNKNAKIELPPMIIAGLKCDLHDCLQNQIVKYGCIILVYLTCECLECLVDVLTCGIQKWLNVRIPFEIELHPYVQTSKDGASRNNSAAKCCTQIKQVC